MTRDTTSFFFFSFPNGSIKTGTAQMAGNEPFGIPLASSLEEA
jgi:hypothetical protein